MTKMMERVKRIGFDLLAIATIVTLLIVIPQSVLDIEARDGVIVIGLTKFLLISLGICHAHITRKLLFDYIKFEDEKDWSNNLMIIAWYVVVIWGWARGG